MTDDLRAEIDKRLGWTANPERAVSWDEAVTIAMAVVGERLAAKDAELDENTRVMNALRRQRDEAETRIEQIADLADQLDSEADVASRAGQAVRLHGIADQLRAAVSGARHTEDHQ